MCGSFRHAYVPIQRNTDRKTLDRQNPTTDDAWTACTVCSAFPTSTPLNGIIRAHSQVVACSGEGAPAIGDFQAGVLCAQEFIRLFDPGNESERCARRGRRQLAELSSMFMPIGRGLYSGVLRNRERAGLTGRRPLSIVSPRRGP